MTFLNGFNLVLLQMVSFKLHLVSYKLPKKTDVIGELVMIFMNEVKIV